MTQPVSVHELRRVSVGLTATMTGMRIQPVKSMPAADVRPGMIAHLEGRHVLVKHVTLGEDGVAIAGPPASKPDVRQRIYKLDPVSTVDVEAPEDVRSEMVAAVIAALSSTTAPGLKVSAAANGESARVVKDGWQVTIS